VHRQATDLGKVGEKASTDQAHVAVVFDAATKREPQAGLGAVALDY